MACPTAAHSCGEQIPARYRASTISSTSPQARPWASRQARNSAARRSHCSRDSDCSVICFIRPVWRDGVAPDVQEVFDRPLNGLIARFHDYSTHSGAVLTRLPASYWLVPSALTLLATSSCLTPVACSPRAWRDSYRRPAT